MQLHRTDSGTYVCVAYNGIGDSVEREIHLTVDGMLCNIFIIRVCFFCVGFLVGFADYNYFHFICFDCLIW